MRTTLGRIRFSPNVNLSLLFEWRDVWVGVYLDLHPDTMNRRVYVILVPMLPLVLEWWPKPKLSREEQAKLVRQRLDYEGDL